MRDLFYLFVIIFTLLLWWGSTNTYKELKPQVGKQMVIDNDTLTIVDFKTLDSSYVLSNGVTVYYKYGNDLIIK